MQKKNKKLVSFCSLATLVISSSVVSTTGVKAADTNTQRIGGADRYETASLISQEGWKNGSDYVVIANGQTGVDALTASPLAKAKDAPILLTEGNTLNPTALAEIKRLGAKHIIFVGGTGVIPESVASQIKSEIPSSDVARYDGKDRFETAVKIAGALGTPSKVFVANGLTFADALSAAPIAAITGSPIILSQDKQFPKVSSDYIKSNSSITKTYVVGGSGVVSDSILNSLPGSQRLGGADRYETNAAIVSAFASELDFSGIYVARGDVFADSLTGSVLAAKNKSAMVITATSGVLSSATEKLFTDLANKGTKIISLGGSGVLPDSIISKIKDAINNSTPVTPTPGGDGTVYPYQNEADAINNALGNYINVKAQDITLSSATLSLVNGSKNPVKEIFASIQQLENSSDPDKETKIDAKIAKVQTQINTVYNQTALDSLKIDGKSVKEFLAGLDSRYIGEDGNLKVDKIKEEINTYSNGQDVNALYSNLRADLKEKAETYFTNHDITPSAVKVRGFSLNNVEYNGVSNSTSYNFNLGNKETADALVDLLLPDSDTVAGTYDFYVIGNDEAVYKLTVK